MGCLSSNTNYSIEQQVTVSMVDALNLKSCKIYTCIRTIFALWTWFVLGMSWYVFAKPEFDTLYDPSKCCIQYWPLQITYWALFTDSIYWACIIYLNNRVNYNYLLQSRCDRLIINIARITYVCGLAASIFVTVFYWLAVYVPSYGEDPWFLFRSINWHGITMLFILIEWFLNSIQLKYIYVIYPLIYSGLYCFLLVIHWLNNWTDASGKHYYVYPVIDFHSDPAKSSIILIISVIFASIIYIIMAMIKAIMMNTCFDNKHDDKLPTHISTSFDETDIDLARIELNEEI